MNKCIICEISSDQKINFVKDKFDYYICEKCKLVYIDREVQNAFSKKEHYCKVFMKNLAGNQNINPITLKRINSIFNEFDKLIPKGKVLEIGCQYGNLLKVAKSRGWEVEGIEPFEDIVEYGKSIGITMYGNELLECNLESERYNLVIMTEVIEHLRNPINELNEINRLLVSGGIFYFTTPNYNSLMRFMLGKDWDTIYPEHLFYFSASNIRKLLINSGFEIIKVKCDNFYPNTVINKYKKLFKHYNIADNNKKDINVDLREKMEEKKLYNCLKKISNYFLEKFKIGSDMKIIARKR